MEDAARAARLFKALSSETRVRIVRLLRDRALCVGALAARLGVSSAAVSQHLRILREAGLVTADKRGYYVHYHLNGAALAQWDRIAADLLTPRRRPARGSHTG